MVAEPENHFIYVGNISHAGLGFWPLYARLGSPGVKSFVGQKMGRAKNSRTYGERRLENIIILKDQKMNSFKESKYIRARERVEELKKFYGNLTSYVFVIGMLAAINYYIDGWGYMWFLWAAFGWGIGLFFHALKTFRLNPFFGKDWEERKIAEFMEEEKRNERWE
jgi:hypothetical protein